MIPYQAFATLTLLDYNQGINQVDFLSIILMCFNVYSTGSVTEVPIYTTSMHSYLHKVHTLVLCNFCFYRLYLFCTDL